MREDKSGDVYKIDRGIKIKEQSSVSSEADHGIVWFRDSDGQPMFTLSNGTVFPIASPPGADWQDSVLDRYDPTGGLPGGPATGARYISTATANGWTDKYIYEYNGSTWDEIVPNEGFATWVEDEDKWYFYNGTNWVIWGNVLATSTAPVDVTKAAASAGSSSELARQDHKHDISTATAGAATPGDSASEGSATSLARSDHQHSLPAFGTGSGQFCEGNDSRVDGAVQESLFDANTILAANTDDTPAALTIAEQRIVGRITSGNITGLTAAQVKTLLGIAPAYGEFYNVTPGAVTTPASGLWIGYQTGASSGLSSNITYAAGSGRANIITTYATYGGGTQTEVTTSLAHGLSAGDIVGIDSTTSYNGIHAVVAVTSTTKFVIGVTFVANDGGSYLHRPAVLTVDSGFGGDYEIQWSADVRGGITEVEAHYGIYVNGTRVSTVRQTLAANSKKEVIGDFKPYTLAADDRVFLGFMNNTDTITLEIENLKFFIKKL